MGLNLYKRGSGLTEEQREKRANLLNGANAVLLGLAAVATAFASYRSAILGGDAIKDYSSGVEAVSDANLFYSTGNQVAQADETLFLEYVKALRQDDLDLAEYLKKEIARPELRAAITWWEQSGDAGPSTPFVEENPEWTIPEFDEADAKQAETDALFLSGEQNDDRGDKFDLAVAIFATALFLYGISAVARGYGTQLTSLTAGSAMFVGGVVYMTSI